MQNRQMSHPGTSQVLGSPASQNVNSTTRSSRTLPVSPGTPLGPIRVNIVNNRTNSPQTTRVNSKKY